MNLRTAIVVLCIAPLFITGCGKKKTKEPFALAKLPDLAYPVVLPPAVTSTTPPQPPASVPTESKSLPQPVRSKPKPRTQRPATITDKTPTQHGAPSSSSSHATNNSGTEANSSISAGLPHTDEAHHRETTSELIQQTEDNLRLLTRQLSTDEQNQVEQIRNFLDQARSATSDNDLVRAHNLALKAHLLSDELLRR